MSIRSAIVLRLAYLALVFPCMLFFLFATCPIVGVPLAALLVIATALKCMRITDDVRLQIRRLDLACLVLTALLLCLVLGQGGFVPQKTDMVCRNPLFADLIASTWPPTTVVDGTTYVYVYYLSYWLPAALVGKLFFLVSPQVGWFAGNLALLVWTTFLAVLIALLLLIWLQRADRKAVLLVVACLFGFSGADILGMATRVAAGLATSGFSPWHFEWWSLPYQYSSHATQLAWVFNQAIPAWLCTVLAITDRSGLKWPLILACAFGFSPFPFVGLLGLACFAAFLEKRSEGTHIVIADGFVWLVMLGVFAVYAAYYSANGQVGVFYCDTTIKSFDDLVAYGIFVLSECGLIIALLARSCGGAWRFWAAAEQLVLIPVVSFVSAFDWCMRVSIPALFVLMAYSVRDILLSPPSLRKAALCIVLVIGMITPLVEIEEVFCREHADQVPVWRYLRGQGLELPKQRMPLWTCALAPVDAASGSFFFRFLSRGAPADGVD